MEHERWQQVERIYHAVAALPQAERASLLDQECAGDADLRVEVDRMMTVESGGIGFLEAPAMEVAARAFAEATAVRPGSRFGPYEVAALLGVGGMGEVFRARDMRLNRDVAIKVLPAFGGDDAGRRARFLQEARTASALKHPNIVTLHDILSEDGRDALVMEYVEGRTLEEKIAGRGLPLPEALHYAIQISRALTAAHAAGVVHRDVKPGNIMVTGREPGTVTVLDFGVSKFTSTEPEADRPGMTATGEGRLVGTVAYMSPEQAEGRTVDARSDIFSFGVVLCEMLTGRKVFLREATASTLAAIERDEVEPVPGIPERLQTLLSRCLQKDPGRRVQYMAEVQVLLEEILEEVEGQPSKLRTASRHWKTWTAAGVIAVAGWLALGRNGSAVAMTVRPITYAGAAAEPSMSPDGKQVAFTSNGEKQDNYDIYIKGVDSSAPKRLTTNPAVDALPAWSPDGRQIAFLRASSPTSRELLLISPLGGAERKLADLSQGVNPASWWTAPAWTPDSRSVAVRDETAIVLVSTQTGEKRKLTSPPDGWTGDSQPAFSPDGGTLAFARIRNGPTQDIFLAPVSEAAKVHQLTHDNIAIEGLAWTPDAREIVFSSSRGADRTLWRISASGGDAQQVPGVGPFASEPDIARHGQRAAFVRTTVRKSFWRLDLGPQALRSPPFLSSPPRRLVISSRTDNAPILSPDGRHIAFFSNRSGTQEVWVCDSHGANAVQLTSLGFARNPYWSPDSARIVFEGRPEGRNLLFVIAAGGGARRQLTSVEGYFPSWSRDGHWIYFYARTSGAIETWKVPADGGNPVQLTKRGGGAAIESMDGKYVYYRKSQEIWKVPVEGGEETLVTSERVNFMNYWAIGNVGMYFTEPRTAEHQSLLKLFRFESGQSTQFAVLDQPFPVRGARLSLPADGSWLLYDQVDRYESDIMLIENFH